MVHHCDSYLGVTITDGGVGKYTSKRTRQRPVTYINKLMFRIDTATEHRSLYIKLEHKYSSVFTVGHTLT